MALARALLCLWALPRSAGIRAPEVAHVVEKELAHSLLATASKKLSSRGEESFPVVKLLGPLAGASRLASTERMAVPEAQEEEEVVVHFGKGPASSGPPGWLRATLGQPKTDGAIGWLTNAFEVFGQHDDAPHPHVPDLVMPKEWGEQLVAHHATPVGGEVCEKGICSIHLKVDTGADLIFKREPLVDPAAKRELSSVAELFHEQPREWSSGHVQQYVDMRSIGATAYILMEGADRSLEELFDEGSQNMFALPLYRSVPMLIDMLRGLAELTAAHLIHEDLSAKDVMLIGDRAIISGLDKARLVGPEFAGVHASKVHAKAAGLLFARMCLGHEPELSEKSGTLDLKGFDPDLAHLLGGMLHPSQDTRWNIEESLSVAEALAVNRLIDYPAPRGPHAM